jgi:hypothetical protein
MRQQDFFLFEKKDGCLCVNTHSQISQSEAFLCLGLFDKTNFTNSSQKGLLICASKLQVFVVNFTSEIYKLIYSHLQVHVQVPLSVLIVFSV